MRIRSGPLNVEKKKKKNTVPSSTRKISYNIYNEGIFFSRRFLTRLKKQNHYPTNETVFLRVQHFTIFFSQPLDYRFSAVPGLYSFRVPKLYP